MYARKVGDKTLTFGVSGLLWENSLVMVDSETESLWSHIIGQCMRGELVDKRLEVIPAAMSDWGTWKSQYPQTTVVMMERSSGVYVRNSLKIFAPGLVMGISDGKTTRNWPLLGLQEAGFVNDHFGDLPVVAAMHRPSMTALLFERRLAGEELTFEAVEDGLLRDQNGTLWDSFQGLALDGPAKGKRLRRLPGVIADHATWDLYHLHTKQTVWTPNKSGSFDAAVQASDEATTTP